MNIKTKYKEIIFLLIFYYIFKYFLTACHEPNIPTNIPIITRRSEAKYTNGVGCINSAIDNPKNLPSKKSYSAI